MNETTSAQAGTPVEGFHPPRYLASAHLQSVLASSPMRRRFMRRLVRPLLERSEDVILDCGDGVRLHGYHAAAGAGPSRGLVPLDL